MTTAKTVPASALYLSAGLALMAWTGFGLSTSFTDWDSGRDRVLVLALLTVAHMATTAAVVLACTRRVLGFLTKSGLIFTEAYTSGHRNGFEAARTWRGLDPDQDRRQGERRVIDLDGRDRRRRLS